MKIGIVGGGISGLSVGQMLNTKHEVTILEKSARVGGLVKCDRIHDCLFHRVGGHVFNSKNQQVLDWFWSFFDRNAEFVSAKRNARILFGGKIIGYPIENYIYELDEVNGSKIILELLELQKKEKRSAFDYPNFESFLKGSFGTTLYETYFQPYNNKIWKTDLSKVSMDWLEGKLPMPNIPEIFLKNTFRKEESNMVHATFFYAKEGGSQFIADRLSRNLKIMTGMDVSSISETGEKVCINNEPDLQYEILIYTADIRDLVTKNPSLFENSGVDVDFLKNLKSNGTSNIFCETDDTDLSWLYIPEPFTSAHRIIYTGNFSNTNNRGSTRKTCVVEFSGKVPFEVMEKELRNLPGNLRAISSNYEPNSYVIQDEETRRHIQSAKDFLKTKNIFLLGRFAEWEYYNMDKAIEAGFAFSDKLSATNWK